MVVIKFTKPRKTPRHICYVHCCPPRPLSRNGEQVDFVYLIATMPGQHSGDQVHKAEKNAAPHFVKCTAALLAPCPLTPVRFAFGTRYVQADSTVVYVCSNANNNAHHYGQGLFEALSIIAKGELPPGAVGDWVREGVRIKGSKASGTLNVKVPLVMSDRGQLVDHDPAVHTVAPIVKTPIRSLIVDHDNCVTSSRAPTGSESYSSSGWRPGAVSVTTSPCTTVQGCPSTAKTRRMAPSLRCRPPFRTPGEEASPRKTLASRRERSLSRQHGLCSARVRRGR